MPLSTGRERQNHIYTAGVAGRTPTVPTDFPGLERRALTKMSDRARAYIAGGAGSGTTMDNNRRALDRWNIVPRVLRDVSARTTESELLGLTLPAPVLFAPVGAGGAVHRQADLLIGQAAATLGLPYIFSNQGSVAMEEVAAGMDRIAPGSPRWFQLYWSTDDDLVDSLLTRAERSGASAITVTLDTTLLGWRPQDLNLGSLPFSRGIGISQYTSDARFRSIVAERLAAGAEKPKLPITGPSSALSALSTLFSIARNAPGSTVANLLSPEPRTAVTTFTDIYSRECLNWNDIAGLQDRTSLPIVLKGVLHPDDARRAVDLGVAAIVVSNHGGRQIDGAIGAADALPGVVDAVDGRVRVLFDSGIRSGSDVFKALALGADAVCIGRPHMYGLALAGAAGAADVVANIVAEFDLVMALAGHCSPDSIDRDSLWRAP
ncbi:alpha-hydroxy-acid oxidizing protein [Rhodococcus sp. BP-332]|uniref:alpha-hydroxy-acid oxidizing protein n=1 Tax=Rhodococcus sp. BP-332 TaxID=2739447 RepID=UPI001C9A79EB|nr:alpha-hydroxy-acid oxidizing protein [Rhodococcus sp. BP-332]MBY6676375.1 alpha-hydroxy-acid oxidizing protein [Rhodococcus sp. BP-332]